MTPNVTDLSAADAEKRARNDSVRLIDVRPPSERALASVAAPFASLDGDGLQRVLSLPRDQPLACLCHHGVRSAQVAQYLLAHGFTEVYNVRGGIEAWAREVDPAIPRY